MPATSRMFDTSEPWRLTMAKSTQVANRITELRAATNMSQAELAT